MKLLISIKTFLSQTEGDLYRLFHYCAVITLMSLAINESIHYLMIDRLEIVDLTNDDLILLYYGKNIKRSK